MIVGVTLSRKTESVSCANPAPTSNRFPGHLRTYAEDGAGFADILRVTVYITDVDDRHAINPIRQGFFGDARPVSTLIRVNQLVLEGIGVEIEAHEMSNQRGRYPYLIIAFKG